MGSISVEVQLTCLGCRQPIACNAILPRFSCDRCGRSAEVPARVWKLVLAEPLREAPRLRPGVEKVSAITTDAGAFQLVFRAIEPACLACRAPIDAEAARGATPSHAVACVCGMRTPARSLAPEVGLPSVDVVLQEDAELLWPSERKEAVALRCANCGGAPTVGAATPRIFACTFCAAQAYVPDDLWSLLHPVRAVKPFVLSLAGDATADAAAPRNGVNEKKARKRQKAGRAADDPGALPETWYEVRDLVVGSDGTLYIVLAFWSEHPTALYAVDLDGRVKWRKELPEKYERYTRLAWMVSGHLCVWSLDERSLLGVRASDGTTDVELGSDKSGRGVDRIDLRKVTTLAADPDGTILVGKAESNGTRFLRYAPSGEPIALWPGLPVVPPWEEEQYCPGLENAGRGIVGAQSVTLGIGWDGLTYIAGDQALACFDRSGAPRRVVAEPECMVDASSGRVWADRRGIAFTTADREVVRYEGWKRKLWLHAEDPSGLLRGEEHGAVAADGTVWMAGSDGALRRFGPDRTLEWASAGARKADRDAADE